MCITTLWLNDISDEEYDQVVDAYDDAASAENRLSDQTHNIKVFRDEPRDAFNRVATQWNKTASEDNHIYRLD